MKKLISKVILAVMMSIFILQVYSFLKENTDTVQIIQEELPLWKLTRKEGATFPAEIRIYTKSSMCSAVVISDIYALTAAHCAVDTWGTMLEDKIYIYDDNHSNTGIIAKFAAIEKHRDVALIKGDFSKFNTKIPNFNYGLEGFGRQVISCGYPADSQFFCIPLSYAGNSFFKYSMTGGPIFQGMSGGPVYDGEYIIGINSSVSSSNVLIGPLVGLVDLWGI